MAASRTKRWGRGRGARDSMTLARSTWATGCATSRRQIPAPRSKFYPLVVNLLNILFWVNPNRPLDASQLGGYLPSEHLDNPMGGKSPEDATATQKERDATYDSLSDEQKAELKQESDPAYKAKIEAASKASGLPDYIERGKQHSKTMFEKSINDQDPAQQQMDLGNGMHGVEDYFSHSNFTEVALATLAKSGNVAAAGAVLDKAKKESDGFAASDAAMVGNDPLGRGAGIITTDLRPTSARQSNRVARRAVEVRGTHGRAAQSLHHRISTPRGEENR